MNFHEFYEFATSCKQVKRFKNTPLAEELIIKLLECARKAPSTLNLQPTHYFLTQDEDKKKKIRRACLQLRELQDCPLMVAFTGDRKVVTHNMEDIFDIELENKIVTEEEVERLRTYLRFNFDQGLLGLTWLAKLIASPFIRLFTSLPLLPAIHKRYFLAKEVSLSAMKFCLAAEAAGLSTFVVTIVDEWRLRRALGIPWSHIVPILVACGYPEELKPEAPLFDFDEVVHWC